MFGSKSMGANAYAKIGVETGVSAASPHRLISMLYDGALGSLSSASAHIKAGKIAEKGAAISKAILIIDAGLKASLDMEAGNEISQNLDALYQYMSRKLFEANINNDAEIVDEIYGLLMDLKGAWNAISDESQSQSGNEYEVGIGSYNQDSTHQITENLRRA